MKEQAKFDYSMFKRPDGKFEFKGDVFNTAEEMEKHFNDVLEMTKRLQNSKLGKLIKFFSKKK